MIIKTKETIDCLLIGHNEMDFEEYEKHVRRMGIQSGAYRDLNLNFLRYNNKPYHLTEVFNLFCADKSRSAHQKPMGMQETFSTAIAYLGTYLHRRGFTFAYVNSFQEEKEKLRQVLLEKNVLTVAVITTLYVSVFPILEVVDWVRQHSQETKIIVGGPFVSTKIRTQSPLEWEYLFMSIDADLYVNSSQGEATLVKIITALKSNLPQEQINNIFYKTPTGYQATPVLRENNRLSENTVNWELFSREMGEYAAVRTSISCPFSCAFCGFPEHAGKYQTMEVEGVEKELNQLNKIGKVKDLNFIDDTFNIPLKRFKQILRVMIKNKYKFKWNSYLRCQFLDRETVELMKESGCEGVFLGLESGSNLILKNMNKKVEVDKYFKGIALLKESGIVTFGNFIIGFPGETVQTVKDTKDFIQESGLDFYRTQLWYCEPITPIWKQREKYNIQGESFEWSHSTMDANTACDLIEDLFLSIKASIWVPQYNFDFDNLWHLVHRGITLDKVIQFLDTFNQGVREKLTNPSKKEMGFEIIHKLKRIFNRDVEDAGTNTIANISENGNPKERGNTDDKYANIFDF